jgi:Flp pilus assembly protein TadD
VQTAAPDHELRRLREALRVRPADAQLHHALGSVLYALRQPLEALRSYEEALRLRPDHAETCNDRGLALQALGRHDEAFASYSAALGLRPDYPEACYNRANAHAALGRFAAAEADYRQAIGCGLRRPEAYNNLALALGELGRMEEAVDHLHRALDNHPTYAEGWYNLARLLERLGRCEEAIRVYERVLELRPDHIDTRWNLALRKLQRGELQEGWRLYEARFANDARQGHRMRFEERRWTGHQSLEGKRVLIWSERGFGDTLQFCRYAPLIRDLGADVTLEVQPRLKALLEGQFPGVHLIGQGEPVPAFDYQCPLLGVARAFGTDLETIPAAVPYLRASPAAIARWSQKLPADTALRIGIVWHGNATTEGTYNRSWPLAALEPLCREKGLRLISLQIGPGAQQVSSVSFADRIVSFGEELDAGPHAFLDTAAILANLDLMISCDTSVAHLAGALGVPVWVALLADSEWRWLLDRTDSPWYPSMRLFRQPTAGDWNAVVDQMCGALAAWRSATPHRQAHANCESPSRAATGHT